MREFFAMGGYAFYVWTSYALACVILAWNILLPHRVHKRFISRLRRRLTQRTQA